MSKNLNIYTNKAISVIVAINLSQVILVAALIAVYFFGDNISFLPVDSFDLVLIGLVSISLINSLLVLKDIRLVRDLSLQNSMKNKSLQNISELNNVLRAQRHDFLNHLQVVYSLIELSEYDEASDYIETVYKDIIKVNRALRTSKAAINALLQAKLVDCENNDILVELHIDTRLDNLVVPDWEMCRVLGNLIDNAIDAVKESKEKGFINIEIVEIDSNYVFTIRNSGKSIPKEMLDSIFEPGYTTKRNRGEGMGLAITKKITQKYNGKITVDSNQSVTTFSVNIPFK